jgi:hypothetical protein
MGLHIRILRPRLSIRVAVEVHGTHIVIKEAIQLLGIAVASARLRLIMMETFARSSGRSHQHPCA